MYFVITIGSTYPSVYWTLIDPFDTLLTIRLGLAIPACGVEIWLVDCCFINCNLYTVPRSSSHSSSPQSVPLVRRHGTERQDVALLVIIHYYLACITKARCGYGRVPAHHPHPGHAHRSRFHSHKAYYRSG